MRTNGLTDGPTNQRMERRTDGHILSCSCGSHLKTPTGNYTNEYMHMHTGFLGLQDDTPLFGPPPLQPRGNMVMT